MYGGVDGKVSRRNSINSADFVLSVGVAVETHFSTLSLNNTLCEILISNFVKIQACLHCLLIIIFGYFCMYHNMDSFM